MSISNLSQEKSRIFIFDQRMVCRFCAHDIFIPYEFYVNVENPGIGCFYVQDVAICQYCGEARHFTDPSGYDNEIGDFVWALKQQLLDVPDSN